MARGVDEGEGAVMEGRLCRQWGSSILVPTTPSSFVIEGYFRTKMTYILMR